MSLTDFLDILDGDEFEEKPVGVREFVTGHEYLDGPPLSENQYIIIEASTQIFKRSTLHNLYGFEEGERRWKQTFNEVIMQLGKGNISKSQKVYSPEYGYVPSERLMEEAWLADSRKSVQCAAPFYNEGIDDIYKVTTKHGYSIECGPNHKFPAWKNTKHMKRYTIGRGQFDLPVSVLSPGDILELKVGWAEPQSPYGVTSDVARLIGYMIGDGSFIRRSRHGNRNPMFTNATPEVQKDIVRIVELLGGNVTYLTSGKGCWQIRINGLNSLFVKLGLIQNYNEQKPWNDEWLSMSNDNMLELIKGVVATDGWISFTAPGKKVGTGTTKLQQAMLGVEMTSEPCIKGLHLALLKIGIVSKFNAHRPERSDGKHSATYRVCITDSNRVKDLLQMVKTIPGKNDRVAQVLEMSLTPRKINDFADRIASIEYIGREETVGTMVEVESLFHAGGIITCNSGKDYTSTIACAYIVYLLLCLKDPARYFNKPPGDAIDILNIAINSTQARNVFFKGFKNRLQKSPWFAGKYNPKMDSVEFKKSITVHSGHSERESWEGYNTLLVILDEISGFATESASGNESAKTADKIYEMYRGSVDSRFPDFGKVLLLSFPRFKDDFIQTRYKDVVAQVETEIKSHTFKIDEEIPDGWEENTFTIEWEEDHIISYRYPKVFAMKRPTWDVNPTRHIEDYKIAFMSNPTDALSRFACMPPESIDAFFKSKEKVEGAFREMNIAVDSTGRFAEWFQPEDDRLYYIHVDLAQKHDRCAVAMAHIDHWTTQRIMGSSTITAPYVVVDVIRYWTPTSDKSVDFTEVKDYILDLKRRGFDIKMVTFDRWNSHDMMEQLKTYGLKSETLSVAKKHYEDMALSIYEERCRGPHDPILIKELLKLRINKDKVDHPRQGSKDLADASCGAIYNAISLTPKNLDRTIEAYVGFERTRPDNLDKKDDDIIRAPGVKIPKELEEALSRMKII